MARGLLSASRNPVSRKESRAPRAAATIFPTQVQVDYKTGASAALSRFIPETSQAVIGRQDAVARIAEAVLAHRFVSIVGTGGLGKTTVANAAVQKLARSHSYDVKFVEFASLSDPDQVVETVAAEFGFARPPGEETESLVSALLDKRIVLVLDNCEHLIDKIGSLANKIFQDAPDVLLLLTSREPMRVDGETIYRLDPLDCPPLKFNSDNLSEVLRYPAARLFAQLAAASRNGTELTDADARHVAKICNQLDGIPLALEIAAARADAMEIDAIAERLAQTMLLMGPGPKSGQPRHQTLQSTLDWSYGLLGPEERSLLRQLSVFSAYFDFNGALAVTRGPDIQATASHLTNLVMKSLVVPWDGERSGYRLLETTRAYAREKLDQESESEDARRKHANYVLTQLKHTRSEWATRPLSEIMRSFRQRIDDVRSALDWCYSQENERELLTQLTVSAIPYWFAAALSSECQVRVDRALDIVSSDREMYVNSFLEMKAAIASAKIFNGSEPGELYKIWSNLLEVAKSNYNIDMEILSLWGLWMSDDGDRLSPGNQILALARTKSEEMVANQMIATSYFLNGEFDKARLKLNKCLSDEQEFGFHPTPSFRRSDNRPFVESVLAKILWIQGKFDEAICIVDNLIDYAISKNHPMSLGYSISSGACPIYLWSDKIDVLKSAVQLLENTSHRHGLAWWTLTSEAYKGIIHIESGNISVGIQILSECMSQFERQFSHHYFSDFYIYLADAMICAGDAIGASGILDTVFCRLKKGKERWLAAEAWRLKGHLEYLNHGSRRPTDVYRYFDRAIEIARNQGAQTWELRAAHSFAGILHDNGEVDRAIRILKPVYLRVNQGFDTADIQKARALITKIEN